MRFGINLLFVLVSCSGFVGCVLPITRTVEDVYTITKEDTTVTQRGRIEPGSRDNGVIYPAPRVNEVSRTLLQTDSVVRRDYPAFIRFGAFESVGLIGSSRTGQGIGTGLFGIYLDPLDMFASEIQGKESKVFGGGLYRFGVFEYRLRWFRDAANWTIGTSLFELIYPEASNEKTLMSVSPLYVRKRFYLREEIPYVCFTTAVGFGFLPSQYVNISGSLDVGSLAGLNLRAYLGFAGGMNLPNTALNETKSTTTSSAPYFGLGISVLDFLNRVPELEEEWKDHKHSGWEIGVGRLMFMRTGQDSSFFGNSFPMQGFQLIIAPVSVALPFLDYRLYAGTELFNLVIAGGNRQTNVFGQTVETAAIGLGILPLRVGYWQPVLLDELSFEPFMEYSYFPSSMFQVGAKLSLVLARNFNIALNTGYISCGGFDTSGEFFQRNFGEGIGAFNTWYFGISFGLLDKIFYEDELRYNRSGQGGH